MRDARLGFRFVIERLDQTLSDLHRVDVNGVLYGDIHLRPGGLEVPRQSGKACLLTFDGLS